MEVLFLVIAAFLAIASILYTSDAGARILLIAALSPWIPLYRAIRRYRRRRAILRRFSC